MNKRIRRSVLGAGIVLTISGGLAAAVVTHARVGSRADHQEPTVVTRAKSSETAAPRSTSSPPPLLASATNAAENILAPINADLGNLSSIIDQVTADPSAPLTDEQTGFIDDLNRRTSYWNNWVGNINEGNKMWDDAQRSIDQQRDEQYQHDRMADTINEINREISNINSWNGTWDFDFTPVAMPASASPTLARP